MTADPDAIERYARLIHDARLSVNAERERPFMLEPWEKRTEEQREQDRRAASAVAAVAVHDAGLDLAAKEMEIRQLLAANERLREALRRHAYTFTDKGTSICGGCLSDAPCPDAELAEVPHP